MQAGKHPRFCSIKGVSRYASSVGKRIRLELCLPRPQLILIRGTNWWPSKRCPGLRDGVGCCKDPFLSDTS